MVFLYNPMKKKECKKSKLKFIKDIEGETRIVGDKKSPKIGNKLRLSLDTGGEPIETESFRGWLIKKFS